jgi:hypothetical protein
MHSCSTDESILQNDSNIKTVTKNQAIEFLQQNPLNLSGSKTSKTTALFNYESITQEKIANSDQLLTVIPLPDNNKQKNSRVVLLTVNDTLKSQVFSMYPDVEQTGNEFSGRILITSVKGEFYKGFRVKNGFIISKFILNSSASSTNKLVNKAVMSNLTEPIPLREVVITAKSRIQTISVAYLYVYSWQIENTSGSDLNWDFTTYSGGGGGASGPVAEEKDPCLVAKNVSVDAQSSIFSSAKTSIETASLDGLEHSITLGRDASGTITQAPMNNGTSNYLVLTNTSWSGAFAALHNHPGNTPLSAGDIYASVKLNVQSSNFTTTFVLTDGEVYGIVITNLAAAQIFVKTYPADQLPQQSPEFPKQIFDEIENLKPDMGYGIEGRTTAIAFILDKYNAGIVVLKQDSNGNFNPIKTEENIQNGVKTYTPKPCN